MDSFDLERKTVKQLIMRFSSSMDSIDKAVQYTSEFVTSQSRKIDTYGLKLVLSEGITNAVVHGNRENEKSSVNIKITLNHEAITIRIKDMGTGFDWRGQEARASADPDDTSGRGLDLIKAYGYSVSFNKDGNIMYLTRQLE